MDESNLIVIGRFGRPNGIKGAISLISYTDPVDNILNYQPWYVRLNQQVQELKITGFEIRNKLLLVQVVGHSGRDEVAALTNVEILVPSEKLPKLEAGEYYWHQLVGLQVVNQEEQVLGRVEEVFATGSNDVLVVAGEKKHLIPYLPGDFIKEVDPQQGLIRVNWDADF